MDCMSIQSLVWIVSVVFKCKHTWDIYTHTQSQMPLVTNTHPATIADSVGNDVRLFSRCSRPTSFTFNAWWKSVKSIRTRRVKQWFICQFIGSVVGVFPRTADVDARRTLILTLKFFTQSYTHVTITTHAPSGTICRLCAGTSYDQPACQIWSFYVHPLRKYEKRWKMQNMGWFGG